MALFQNQVCLATMGTPRYRPNNIKLDCWRAMGCSCYPARYLTTFVTSVFAVEVPYRKLIGCSQSRDQNTTL